MASVYSQSTQPALGTPFDNTSNGFVATNVQDAIEEATHVSTTYEVSDTNNATTTSSTDAILPSMTITPTAGTYLVLFSSSITLNSAGNAVSVSLYVGGVQKPATLMKSSVFDGGALSAASARGCVAINSLATVNGSQAITIQWSVSAGTATCGPRVMNLLRVA